MCRVRVALIVWLLFDFGANPKKEEKLNDLGESSGKPVPVGIIKVLQ